MIRNTIATITAIASLVCLAPTVLAEKPNIIFIMLDDLGKEWVSCYGADEIETPQMDKLAAEGMKFDCAYSMPQCTPSRITLMTGQYPNRHGWVNHWDVPRWGKQAHFDPTKYPTIGNVMKEAGYATCAAGKWQVDDFRVEPNAMKDSGFDEWCMWTGFETGNPADTAKRYWDPYIYKDGKSQTYAGKFGPDMYAKFIFDFIKDKKDRPFFVYWPMALTHGPFVNTPLHLEAKTKMEKHKAMVLYVDHLLKQLRDNLEAQGGADNTMIIFTTDNGTTGGITGKLNGVSVKGGKMKVTESGVNAPFIVYWKGKVAAGSTSKALVDFTDILPTCAELAGVKVDAKTIDGHSFVASLLDAKNNGSRKWIMALGANPAGFKDGRVVPKVDYRERVLRDQKWKVRSDEPKLISALYDLENDPFEKNNLLDSDEAGAVAAKAFFQTILDQQPEKDAAPLYDLNPVQVWDKKSMKKGKRNRRKKNKAE